MDEPNSTGKLYVISGPSGSGKSTLCRLAIPQTSAQLSVSATTRSRSDGEVDGKDYHFLSREDFEKKIQDNKFLEYAQVFGNYYGTPAREVKQMLTQGQTVVLEIDVQGATEVFKNHPEAIGILILPPSREELEKRLRRRGREDESAIGCRLRKAQWEIEQAQKNDHYKHCVVNDQLEEAINKLVTLIGKKE
jgi:guanylate kinase